MLTPGVSIIYNDPSPQKSMPLKHPTSIHCDCGISSMNRIVCSAKLFSFTWILLAILAFVTSFSELLGPRNRSVEGLKSLKSPIWSKWK